MISLAPAVVSVLVLVVPLDMVPLGVKSLRLLRMLLFIATALPSDIPVLFKLNMDSLMELSNIIDCPFNAQVVPELI